MLTEIQNVEFARLSNPVRDLRNFFAILVCGQCSLVVQGHKNGLLGTDSGVGKWPIRLSSNV